MADEMTNEKQEKTGMEGLKRAQTFFLGLVFGALLALIFDIIGEYRDYKAHPDYYIAPYPSFQSHLELAFSFHGVVILICLSIWVVLKIVERRSVVSDPN